MAIRFGAAAKSSLYNDLAYLRQRARTYATTVVQTLHRAEPQFLMIPLKPITVHQLTLLATPTVPHALLCACHCRRRICCHLSHLRTDRKGHPVR